MKVSSDIIDDQVSKNALHKLETKYAWIYDPIYPDFIKRMKQENDILISSLKEREHKHIVELGSGSARQSWLFQKSGFESEALELSPEMVELGTKRVGKEHIQVGDARNFKTDEQSGAVVLGPLVTCYFLNDSDLTRTLNCAFDSLASGGLLLCEFIAAGFILTDPFYNGFSKQEFKINEGRITRFNEAKLDLRYNARYDWFSTYIFDLKGGLTTDTDRVLLRAYWPSEVETLFHACGFQILSSFGYDGENFLPLEKMESCSTLLYLAQKKD